MAKALAQDGTSHRYGRSPVCERSCTCDTHIVYLVLNKILHIKDVHSQQEKIIVGIIKNDPVQKFTPPCVLNTVLLSE